MYYVRLSAAAVQFSMCFSISSYFLQSNYFYCYSIISHFLHIFLFFPLGVVFCYGVEIQGRVVPHTYCGCHMGHLCWSHPGKILPIPCCQIYPFSSFFRHVIWLDFVESGVIAFFLVNVLMCVCFPTFWGKKVFVVVVVIVVVLWTCVCEKIMFFRLWDLWCRFNWIKWLWGCCLGIEDLLYQQSWV